MTDFRALGKRPPTQNGSSLNEEHFYTALLEAADVLGRINDDKSRMCVEVGLTEPLHLECSYEQHTELAWRKFERMLRLSAGVEKRGGGK